MDISEAATASSQPPATLWELPLTTRHPAGHGGLGLRL